MLKENTLYGVVDKVKVAIKRLQLHVPPEGYYVAFSGGKDSMATIILAKENNEPLDTIIFSEVMFYKW